MRQVRRLCVLCAAVFTVIYGRAQSVAFYSIDSIQTVEIFFSQPYWDYQLDTSKLGLDEYVPADSVKVNGELFTQVGVKYKGNSSYDSTYTKNSLHIALDEYSNQDYNGYTDIKLGNNYADPSMLREVLAYSILGNYMEAPRCNFARVYINGVYHGLYSNEENVDKKFCERHFYSQKNTFIKGNPVINPGPNTKSNLKYITGADSTSYYNFYEIKSKYGWQDLMVLCDSVTNQPASFETMLDVDRWLWMLAFNNALVNLDSYSGVFAQNYYLYRDNIPRYNPIVWDLNMAFGGFPYLGNSNNSMGTLSIANMQQLPPGIHSTDAYWPVIKDVYANATFKRMYLAHLKTIVDENFANGTYLSAISQWQGLIGSWVQADTNKFFTNTNFQQAVDSNIIFGSYQVPGLATLVNGRVSYLQASTLYTDAPPVITSVQPLNNSPLYGATVAIAANITNVTGATVYLGYRFNKTQKFTRVAMRDDGLLGDVTSGDNVFTAQVQLTGVSVQYYVYAENSAAGIFSPVRAEYEFYDLTVQHTTAAAGQVVINEVLASNTNGAEDENHQHADWIELYNTTANALNLNGWYISDDTANLAKFAFPANTIMPPQGFLTLWADDKEVTLERIHTSFNLASNGEAVLLSNGTAIYDSVSFSQQATDVSIGRCADGTGAFQTFNTPTFNAPNCPTGIVHAAGSYWATVYPNPANSAVWLLTSTVATNIVLYNMAGQPVAFYSNNNQGALQLPANIANGIYLLRFAVNNTFYARQVVVIK